MPRSTTSVIQRFQGPRRDGGVLRARSLVAYIVPAEWCSKGEFVNIGKCQQMRRFDEGTYGVLLYEAYLGGPGGLWKEVLVPHLLDEFCDGTEGFVEVSVETIQP